MEGLIFGEAYLWREICVLKSIGLALQLEVNLLFLLRFTLYLRAIFRVQAPGSLYLEGRFNKGFFTLPVWGAYTWRGLFLQFYGNVIDKWFWTSASRVKLRQMTWPSNSDIRLTEMAIKDMKVGLIPTGIWPTPQNTKQP